MGHKRSILHLKIYLKATYLEVNFNFYASNISNVLTPYKYNLYTTIFVKIFHIFIS